MSSLTVMAKDAETGEPVHMATVYIVPEGDTLAAAFTFTDKKGSASLKDFAAGKYMMNIQMLGFRPYAKGLLLEANTHRTMSVALEQDLQELEGASITEMGDLVTVKGDTLIYNATSFNTASNSSLGELLKKMPGIEVEKGRVKVNGEPVKRITVEGKTFFFDDQSKALENLPAS
ncbi:MAG: carboxypeptidase-like regulatory domain-containing protein [Bacteroidales bacterium]|nr:carboxypeptidase-like regulatory domain-containing protein [Bacteroidales bacterium]